MTSILRENSTDEGDFVLKSSGDVHFKESSLIELFFVSHLKEVSHHVTLDGAMWQAS